MNVKYKSNNNIVYSCKYHVVWCAKYRRKVLTDGVDVRLKELLLEYAANLSVDILEMEIMPDHVHILMEVAPQFGIHKAVKSLKGYTVSWSKFFDMLTYKSVWYGNDVVKVPTMYPSSQTCSACGYKNPLVKNLAIRSWMCPECGTKHNRDTNASINILNKGLQIQSA